MNTVLSVCGSDKDMSSRDETDQVIELEHKKPAAEVMRSRIQMASGNILELAERRQG